MITAMKEELDSAGLSNVAITGSTEENFPTCMTALSVTVIGVGEKLKFEPAKEEDVLVLIGSPKFGAEVDVESPGFYTEISRLLSMPQVKEIVPVGSKGIEYEAVTLASLSNMEVSFANTGIDYKKSAGPATCVLVLCNDKSICEYGVVVGYIKPPQNI